MSNQQWNQPQGSDWTTPQPEGTSEPGQPPRQDGSQSPRQEWGQQQDWTQQGQTSASEWGQPVGQPSASQGGQGWHQAQPQQSAGDWHQAQPQQSSSDWAQAQPQQSAGDWNQTQPGARGWDPNQQWQGQQGWDQQGQPSQPGWDQQGQHAQQAWDQQQQWGQQPQQGYQPAGVGYQGGPAQPWTPAPKKPSPFDFSFSKPSLPAAAGTIFLIGSVGLGLWWLFQLISSFTYLLDFPLEFFGSLLGNAGLALFGIMVLRTLLEIGVGVLNKPEPKAPEADDAEDTTAN